MQRKACSQHIATWARTSFDWWYRIVWMRNATGPLVSIVGSVGFETAAYRMFCRTTAGSAESTRRSSG